MISVPLKQKLVSGTTLREIGRVRLASGIWDIDLILGVPSAVSTATVYVRAAGSDANLLVFSSSVYPERLATQRLELGSETEVVFYAANSSASVGVASIDDIRAVGSNESSAVQLRIKRPIGGEQ